ncbi:hypothetical protein ABK040_016034 [Willaertia magna]
MLFSDFLLIVFAIIIVFIIKDIYFPLWFSKFNYSNNNNNNNNNNNKYEKAQKDLEIYNLQKKYNDLNETNKYLSEQLKKKEEYINNLINNYEQIKIDLNNEKKAEELNQKNNEINKLKNDLLNRNEELKNIKNETSVNANLKIEENKNQQQLRIKQEQQRQQQIYTPPPQPQPQHQQNGFTFHSFGFRPVQQQQQQQQQQVYTPPPQPQHQHQQTGFTTPGFFNQPTTTTTTTPLGGFMSNYQPTGTTTPIREFGYLNTQTSGFNNNNDNSIIEGFNNIDSKQTATTTNTGFSFVKNGFVQNEIRTPVKSPPSPQQQTGFLFTTTTTKTESNANQYKTPVKPKNNDNLSYYSNNSRYSNKSNKSVDCFENDKDDDENEDEDYDEEEEEEEEDEDYAEEEDEEGNNTVLINYFRKNWKDTQRAFCNKYKINEGNFSGHINLKKDSPVAKKALKRFYYGFD